MNTHKIINEMIRNKIMNKIINTELIRLSLFISLFVVSSLIIISSISHDVYAIDYGDKSSIEATVVSSNNFHIISKSPQSSIRNISLVVDSFPKNDSRQTVNSIILEPSSGILTSDGNAYFSWDHPATEDFSFSMTSKVKSVNIFYGIPEKVDFPIKSLDASFYEYTQPTDIIDITPEIKDTASELSSGVDDLYELEYIYADYVRRNVAYDLGSLTADIDQKSSWVLKNKIGVCDEITNLFISLNRASGIPARFVSGVAYTNLDIFGTNWVPHAWAEVYFPKYGWVPYDVTYGEYGYIDAGHIMFTVSSDVTSANVKYSYVGNDISMKTESLNTEVNVGFNSYDLVAVDIVNNEKYYQVADIYLADTEDVNIIDDAKETVLNKTVHRKEVLLKPYESKIVYWIIHLDGNFEKKYIYTLPITSYNSYNQTSTVNQTMKISCSIM